MARAREFALAEAQAAAAEAGAGEGEGEGGVALEGGEEGVEAFERDLDAEVPDADGDGDAGGGGEGVWSDADEEDEAEEEEGLEGAEQTLLEEVEVGGFVAVAGDGGGGVDLDAEVPEAEGSYEHTDTEVEDESSGDEGGPVRGVFGRAGQGLVLGGNGGGGVLGRSVFGSSPVRTGRRGSGRGRGREN